MINIPEGFIPWNPECGLLKPNLEGNKVVDVIFGDGEIVTGFTVNYWSAEGHIDWKLREMNNWKLRHNDTTEYAIYGYKIV